MNGYLRSPHIRTAVDDQLLELRVTSGRYRPFAVTVMDKIAHQTQGAIKGPCGTPRQLLLLTAKHGLSPKVILEGIPEVQAMQVAMRSVIAAGLGPLAGRRALAAALADHNVPYNRADSGRKAVEDLVHDFSQAVAGKRKRPRTARDLEPLLRAAGVNPNPRVLGKRTRLSVEEMRRIVGEE